MPRDGAVSRSGSTPGPALTANHELPDKADFQALEAAISHSKRHGFKRAWRSVLDGFYLGRRRPRWPPERDAARGRSYEKEYGRCGCGRSRTIKRRPLRPMLCVPCLASGCGLEAEAFGDIFFESRMNWMSQAQDAFQGEPQGMGQIAVVVVVVLIERQQQHPGWRGITWAATNEPDWVVPS